MRESGQREIPEIKWYSIIKGRTPIFTYFIDVEEQTISYYNPRTNEYWGLVQHIGFGTNFKGSTEEEFKQIAQKKWEKFCMENVKKLEDFYSTVKTINCELTI